MDVADMWCVTWPISWKSVSAWVWLRNTGDPKDGREKPATMVITPSWRPASVERIAVTVTEMREPKTVSGFSYHAAGALLLCRCLADIEPRKRLLRETCLAVRIDPDTLFR